MTWLGLADLLTSKADDDVDVAGGADAAGGGAGGFRNTTELWAICFP